MPLRGARTKKLHRSFRAEGYSIIDTDEWLGKIPGLTKKQKKTMKWNHVARSTG